MENQNNKPIEDQMDICEVLDIPEESTEIEILKSDNASLMQQAQTLQTKLTNAETEIEQLKHELAHQQELFLIKMGKMAYNMFD